MGIFFLIFGVYSMFVGYEAFRYKRLYWFFPSIMGFKKRKEKESPKTFSRFIGIYMFLLAAIQFFFAYKLLKDLP
jgi:hypothetical protein